MENLSRFIEDIALRLPSLPKQPPKNLFDILGVRNKEVINSRVLAYFLDAKESHGFNNLVFDSLIAIIKKKKYCNDTFLAKFSDEFQIQVEESTQFADKEKNKRIDILVSNKEWGIIIENKLYHNVNNPLEAYWEHTEKLCGINIIGLILTLHSLGFENDKKEVSVRGNKVNYLNITHKEWITEVQKQLKIGEVKNVDALLYLKEYIKTIESHYQSKMDEPKFNTIVSALTAHKDDIREIKQKYDEAVGFLERQTTEIFESYGYTRDKQWFIKDNCKYKLVFFMRKAQEILDKNDLWFCFEVRDETFQSLRESGKENLIEAYFREETNLSSPYIVFGDIRNSNNAVHFAKYYWKEDFITKETNFKTVLAEILDTHFMGENGIVNSTIKFLEQHKIEQIIVESAEV